MTVNDEPINDSWTVFFFSVTCLHIVLFPGLSDFLSFFVPYNIVSSIRRFKCLTSFTGLSQVSSQAYVTAA